MNSLLSDMFRKFRGVSLGVCAGLFAGCLGGVWETFWRCLGVILGGKLEEEGVTTMIQNSFK